MDKRILDIERSILEQRANKLATVIEASEENLEIERFLVFSAIESRFAIPLEQVDAVNRISDIIPIPHTPAHIQGVIRRRGQTIALVNLRFFFYPGMEALIDEDYAVSVRVKRKLFALQVEDVEGVVPLLKSSIIAVPESYDQALRPYLSGITMDGLAIINLNDIIVTPNFGTSPIEG